MKTTLFVIFSLLAFAGNSVLCRLALGEGAIDAASFTSIRLLSGILVLLILVKASKTKERVAASGSWKASFMLFLYAIAFSYAYNSLETGMGALILFASVQLSMIIISLVQGARFSYVEYLGLSVAFGGFVYLVLPGVSAPPMIGFCLMVIGGVAWGLYTLSGAKSKNPLADTYSNFVRTLPYLVVLLALTFQSASLSSKGIILAVLSGALASGLGYAIWYAALRSLSSIQAAVIQLLVPLIAAFGGVMFADELFSSRLLLSSALILGGVLVVIMGKSTEQENVEALPKP